MNEIRNIAMDLFISKIRKVDHLTASEVIKLAETFKGFESSIWNPFMSLLIMIDIDAEAFKIISSHVSKMCQEVLGAEAMNIIEMIGTEGGGEDV